MLTPLDRGLCTLLAKLGYLRTDQVVEARHQLARQQGLPVAQKEAAALRSVQRRLRQLVEGRILRRIRQPVFAGEGSKPYVYALDRLGAEVACAETGLGLQALDWKPKESAPGGHPSLLFLDHTLAIGDFYLALTRACLAHQVTLAEWTDERTLKRRPARVPVTLEDGRRTTVALIPDAVCRLQLASGQATWLFCEIDRGSMTLEPARPQLRAWRRKFLAYRFLDEEGLLAAHYGARSRIVVVVTTSPARADHLVDAAARAGAGPWLWVTTFADLKGDLLRGAIWRVATRGSARYALLPGSQ